MEEQKSQAPTNKDKFDPIRAKHFKREQPMADEVNPDTIGPIQTSTDKTTVIEEREKSETDALQKNTLRKKD